MKQETAGKVKLIKILEILTQESDGDHPLSTGQIINKLQSCGISCDRRTLASDIKALNLFGYEVLTISSIGRPNLYYIADRSFDLPELRILIDAVQSASFIPHKKTNILIDKIANLGGSHRGELLINNIVEYNTKKHTNEHIFYNINEIEQAITLKKKISFLYFDYNSKLEKVFRREGKKYYVNPISMVITQDNYYLVCYDDFHNSINHYRIDRMAEVKVTRFNILKTKLAEDFNLNNHHKQVFGMFVGNEEEVTIEFDNRLIDTVIDKFGEEVNFVEEGEKIRFTTFVQISPQFFAWVCSFGNGMKLLEPKWVVDGVTQYIKSIYDLYV